MSTPTTGTLPSDALASPDLERWIADELRLTDREIRTTLNLAPLGVVLVDLTGKVIRSNEGFASMIGWRREDLSGRSVTDFTRAEDLMKSCEVMQRVRRTGLSETVEKCYVHRNGSLVYGRTTVSIAGNADEPRLLAIVSVATRARLDADRLRFQTLLLDSVEQAVIATDLHGTITYCNRFAERLYGWAAEEVLGRDVKEVIPTSGTGEKDIRESLTRRESWSGELELRRRDGSVFTGSVTISIITDPEGLAVGFVGVSQDLTEAKGAEVALRTSESRYRELVESAHEGISILDAHGVIQFVNAEVVRFCGYSEEELVGQQSFRFVHPADREILKCPDSLSNRDVRILRKDGQLAWATLSRSTLLDGRRLVVMMDVTSRKQTEAALLASEELLARTQRIARLGSWDIDLTSGVRRWSPEVFELLGLPPGSDAGFETLLDQVIEADRDIVRGIDTALCRGETRTFEYRVAINGRIRTLLSHGEVRYDESGTPARVHGFVQDVTDRKRDENELRRHSLRQDVIAKVSAFALVARSVSEIVKTTVELVLDVLTADRVEFRECQSCAESRGVRSVARESFADRSNAYACSEPSAILASVCATGEGTPAARLVGEDTESGEPVWVIAWPAKDVDGALLGVLVAYSNHSDSLSVDDSNFIRTIANVLGQAIERQRADTELREVAQQQLDLAEFARRSLGGVTPELLDFATSLVKKHLRAEFSVLYEVDGSTQSLIYKAGDRLLPQTESVTGRGFLATALSLRSGTVLRLENVKVGSPPNVGNPGESAAISGICTCIRGTLSPLAILGAFSLSPRKLKRGEERFLQGIAATLADVLEREVARRALAASEERYRAVVEGASEVIYTLGSDGTFTSLNMAFGRLTGWKREQWLGRPFIELVSETDYGRAREAFGEVLRGGRIEEKEFSIVGLNGDTRALRISANPMMKDGRIIGIQGFGRDVTQTKRVEAESEKLTRGIQLLLESTAEGILALDPDGKCALVNRAASQLLATSPEDLTGRQIHAIIHPGCPGCAIDRAQSGNTAERVCDDIFHRPDGSTLPVEFAIAPIMDDGFRRGAVLTFSDTSSRIQLEAQLEQANRLTSLGRLAATIAHEFNNVLMGISPFVELLRNPALTRERRKTALEHIAASTTRGKRVTEEILRYTRPAPPVVECISASALRQELLADLESILTPSHQVSFEIVNPEIAILADRNQLHQILANLLVNARDAMPDGGSISISLARPGADAHFDFGVVAQPERFVHIQITDTGEGMSSQTLRHAFEPLFTTKRNGTGLGLAITHQIVKQHEGEIFVQSTEGEGSTFHLFLPLSLKPGDEEAMRLPGPTTEYSPWRVLLVEDDPDVAAGIQMLLGDSGAAVSTVSRGSDVVPALDLQLPDVVILDIGLPDIDGTSVYEEFSEKFPALPVVFSTGHGDQRKIEHHLAKRNVGMLLKPYSIETLLETIESVMPKSSLKPQIVA